MPHNHSPRTSSRTYTPADHARALAVILREEFDTPFVFQDAATGAVVAGDGEPRGLRSEGLSPPQAAEVAGSGQARITRLPCGRYQLALPLYASCRPILVATGTLAPLARLEADAAAEQRRLEKWGQAVCERLRGSDYIASRGPAREEGTQEKTPWEAILALDHLLRHLRVHKNSMRNQERILQAAFALLRVEALAWVPCDPAGDCVIQGEMPLTAGDCRRLAGLLARSPDGGPAGLGSGPILCNEVPSHDGQPAVANLRNLLGFLVTDEAPAGWVIALNKRPAPGQAGASAPFRRSDAALLTPFVALLGLQTRTAGRYLDLKELLVGLTRSLTAALDAKDAYTCGHSERVARIAVELSQQLGLNEDEIGNIYLAGLLHDIGKIGVSDAVLHKADRLTAEEYEHIKRHVTIGYAILSDLHQIRDVLPGVLYHHERYDGQGYPEGLVGEGIPLLARILAVADAYDAMSTTRPYRTAMAAQRVEEILIEGADKQWDRRVIEAFTRCRQTIRAIRQRGIGESLKQALDSALNLNQKDSASVALRPQPVEPIS